MPLTAGNRGRWQGCGCSRESAGAGGEKQQRARRGRGLAQGRSGAPAVSHGLSRGRQRHCPSTEDVRRFRESETQRGLAGRQRDKAERQEEARHALITGRREVSMSREEVAAAVARGFKSAEGLVTSSLRGLGNHRGAALVAAANHCGHSSTGLPVSVREQVCCGANECAGDQLTGTGGPSPYVEARDCDDSEGRVGGAGMETCRGEKRAREVGHGGEEEGRDSRVMRCDGPSGVARRTREDDAPT